MGYTQGFVAFRDPFAPALDAVKPRSRRTSFGSFGLVKLPSRTLQGRQSVEVCTCTGTQTVSSAPYGSGLLPGRFVRTVHLTSSWFGSSSRSLPRNDHSLWVFAHGKRSCRGAMSTSTPSGNESEMYTR